KCPAMGKPITPKPKNATFAMSKSLLLFTDPSYASRRRRQSSSRSNPQKQAICHYVVAAQTAKLTWEKD
ncbi:MAG: hypothetical protein ACJAXT_001083, partial [Paracoccaceae bacterium]